MATWLKEKNQSETELFAKKFASFSSNTKLTADFLTRRATFEQPSGESNITITDDYAINTPFEPHELREALR